jgi:hypothetical protein
MNKDNKTQLLDQLTHYGYSLLTPQVTVSPDKVLESLLRQDDARLLEGFPVVLAGALAGENVFAWENRAWVPQKAFSSKMAERWVFLMALSLLLSRLFGVETQVQDRAMKLLRKYPEGEKILKGLEKEFSGSGTVVSGGLKVSLDRLKNSFRDYRVQQSSSGERQEQREALEFELLLSELFTARQKELLSKRRAGKPMSKIEREYYYRVVKKRLKALADDRLHQLARQLVYA